jgi:GT2 family glycosyltransferase
MTSYNRRDQTLRCLESLLRSDHHAALQVILVDDASTDGTADAVSAAYPEVNLVEGTGNLYWAGGMRLAYQRARDQPFDYLLWLNDDVTLASNAVAELVETERELRPFRGPVIVVGALQDPLTGLTAYSGVRRAGAHRTRFSPIPPGNTPRRAETMNGNVVLVPQDVAERLGTFDPAYRHGIADYDYGLRAGAIGIEVWVAPDFLGNCTRNPPSEAQLTGRTTLRQTMSLKGVPPSSWLVFTRRHAGAFWPLYWASPYVKAALRWER